MKIEVFCVTANQREHKAAQELVDALEEQLRQYPCVTEIHDAKSGTAPGRVLHVVVTTAELQE